MSNRDFYLSLLYPLQDKALRLVHSLDTGFYLTGGTAASRGYLNHRYSDDLGFFVDDDEHFRLWAERIIQALTQENDWTCQVILREERFYRLNLQQSGVNLKLEWVNDVPARVGTPVDHPIWGSWIQQRISWRTRLLLCLIERNPKTLPISGGFVLSWTSH